jgi:hypothetical protein
MSTWFAIEPPPTRRVLSTCVIIANFPPIKQPAVRQNISENPSVRKVTTEGEMEPSTTYDAVNDHYSRLAREMAQDHDEHSQKAALLFGYSADELSAIPEGSNLGVSCGNPVALAALKEASSPLFYVLVACKMRYLMACSPRIDSTRMRRFENFGQLMRG